MAWSKAGPGRPKGSKNKASREWKDLVRSICSDPEAQETLRRACIERPELMFKAAEHAYGKPHQSQSIDLKNLQMIDWPDRVVTDEDLEDGRDNGNEAA